jgi:hypothetical protein
MNSKSISQIQPAKRKRAGGGRAFHSRLEPFVEFIRQQRQRRQTWKEIAATLAAEKGCPITTQGVHQFYRRYVQRRAKPHWEDPTSASQVQPVRPGTPASRAPLRPAPLPPPANFKRPNLATINQDQFT